MSDLQPPRGTRDILPEDHRRHRHVTDTAFAIAGLYGYGEISTPIFEATDVFSRTLGETSDVVTKEMYTFDDRKGRSITLRPEGTAGVAANASSINSESNCWGSMIRLAMSNPLRSAPISWATWGSWTG